MEPPTHNSEDGEKSDYGSPPDLGSQTALMNEQSASTDLQIIEKPEIPEFVFLYQSMIKIKCGANVEFQVHKEKLCSLSRVVASLFSDANVKIVQLGKFEELKDSIEEELDEKPYDSNTLHSFIRTAFSKFPLPNYRTQLKTAMNEYINAKLFGKKEYSKPPFVSGGLPKRGPQANYPGPDIPETLDRVDQLKAEGKVKLAEWLRTQFGGIESDVNQQARKDRFIAAALGTLDLQEYEPIVVKYFIHWLYSNEIFFESSMELCRLYSLAQELGFDELADQCLERVSEAVAQKANSLSNNCEKLFNPLTLKGGTSLRRYPRITDLRDPLGDIFDAILLHACHVRDPPPLFKGLIEDVLAWGGNRELFEEVASKLPPQMILNICKSVFERAAAAEAGKTGVLLKARLETRLLKRKKDRMGRYKEDYKEESPFRSDGVYSVKKRKLNGTVSSETTSSSGDGSRVAETQPPDVESLFITDRGQLQAMGTSVPTEQDVNHEKLV